MPLSRKHSSRADWKLKYFEKLETAIRAHSKFILVHADNVSSYQFAQIRQSIRGKATVVMGKNTMMKKVISGMLDEFPDYEKVCGALVSNVGFVFTNNELVEVRDLLLENKLPAAARAGAISPIDVIVPAQNTGLGPEKTSFFQALSIPTKIARGTIEITNDVHLLKPGDKVGMSEATLLSMLKIYPFSYGLKMVQCFEDGTLFDPKILDLTNSDIVCMFMKGVSNIASVSLNIGYPTVASAPHIIANGFKKCLAVAAATEITFTQAEKMKEYLADPTKFVAPVADQAKIVEVVKEEEEEDGGSESSSMGGLGGFFD